MITALACLAFAIYFEARGESIDGKLAIVDVILERVIDKRWPDTICGVVKQKEQFSFYSSNLIINDITAYKEAVTIANHVLHGYVPAIVDANHYHTLDVSPKWARNKRAIMIIGNHKFYKF